MAPTAKAARRPGKLDVECEFRLSVETPSRSPYDVAVVQTVPHDKLVAPGHVVPVAVSASDDNDVVIVFDELPDAADRAKAAASAAKTGDVAEVAKALGFELADQSKEQEEP
jgi:hypothetical protein